MVLKRATFTVFARGWSNEGAKLNKKKLNSNKIKFQIPNFLLVYQLEFGI